MKIFPIFIPFAGCDCRCIYCQQNLITRTIAPDFPEIKKHLRGFCSKYPEIEKEIAFYGGSFTLLPFEEQSSYLSMIKDFIPQVNGVRVSTRPDGINPESLDFALKNGIRTIELGVQSFSDTVLKKTGRPYGSEEAIEASFAVKKAGLKLGIQLMPGLPGEDRETLTQTTDRTVICNPDFARLYPTLVLRDTPLEELFKKGLYQPMSLDEGVSICADIKMKLESHGIKVIKTGLHSDLSQKKINTEDDDVNSVVAGPYHPAFGELVSQEILYRNVLQTYQPGKSLLISYRAVSLLRRSNEYLIQKIKNSLTLKTLPIVIGNNIQKEKVLSVERKAEFLW